MESRDKLKKYIKEEHIEYLEEINMMKSNRANRIYRKMKRYTKDPEELKSIIDEMENDMSCYIDNEIVSIHLRRLYNNEYNRSNKL